MVRRAGARAATKSAAEQGRRLFTSSWEWSKSQGQTVDGGGGVFLFFSQAMLCAGGLDYVWEMAASSTGTLPGKSCAIIKGKALAWPRWGHAAPRLGLRC